MQDRKVNILRIDYNDKLILKSLISEKASLSIEAGISLSVLIFVLMMLIILIRGQQSVEASDQCLFEAAKYVQIKSVPSEKNRIINAAFLLREVEGKYGELARKKNINPGLCKIKVKMVGDYECDVIGNIRFSFAKKPFFERICIYRVILSGITLTDCENSFTVTAYGGRFHNPECHIVRGKTGVTYTTVEEAVEHGKTPCNICISKKMFGKKKE